MHALSLVAHVEVHGERLSGLSTSAELCVQGLHVMASSWPATAYMLQRKDSPALLRAPLVHDIARKLGKKPSQVLLNWAIAHSTTVSPKAGSFEQVQVCRLV